MATTRPFGFFPGFPGGTPDPFRELRRLQEEMGRLAGALVPAGAGGPALAAAAGGFPAVNVFAGRDGIAIVAELPGVEAGDLEVHAHQDTLTILGARRPASEDAAAYHRRERRSGAFTRTVQLPYRVDPGRVEARLEDGVLRLSLGRPEEDKPRRIEVKG